MKWILIVIIAVGPQFELAYSEKAYISEEKCKAALERIMENVAFVDGQMVIGKCEPRPYNGGKAGKAGK